MAILLYGAAMADAALRVKPDGFPRLFNTPLECGFRLLFVLAASGTCVADLQRLVSYDYLLVHSGDVQSGPPSLHPAVPHRGSEWIVKRDIVNAGLKLVFARQLINKELTTRGIVYQGTEMTTAFISLLKSPYADNLRERSAWLIDEFSAIGDDELQAFMTDRVGKWGAEFERLAALEDFDL